MIEEGAGLGQQLRGQLRGHGRLDALPGELLLQLAKVQRITAHIEAKALRLSRLIGPGPPFPPPYPPACPRYDLLGSWAVEHDGMLYLSSLTEPHFARVKLTP